MVISWNATMEVIYLFVVKYNPLVRACMFSELLTFYNCGHISESIRSMGGNLKFITLLDTIRYFY
jgi:hypothetical protein